MISAGKSAAFRRAWILLRMPGICSTSQFFLAKHMQAGREICIDLNPEVGA